MAYVYSLRMRKPHLLTIVFKVLFLYSFNSLALNSRYTLWIYSNPKELKLSSRKHYKYAKGPQYSGPKLCIASCEYDLSRGRGSYAFI